MLYALIFSTTILTQTPDLKSCLQVRAATILAFEVQAKLGILYVCPDVEQLVCMRRV